MHVSFRQLKDPTTRRLLEGCKILLNGEPMVNCLIADSNYGYIIQHIKAGKFDSVLVHMGRVEIILKVEHERGR